MTGERRATGTVDFSYGLGRSVIHKFMPLFVVNDCSVKRASCAGESM